MSDQHYWLFRAACLAAALAGILFLLWVSLVLGGARLTDAVDVLGELVAALLAAGACAIAARRVVRGQTPWILLGLSSLAWAIGEAIWSFDDLVLGIQVPFPSWADLGFLSAVPLAVAALFLFPSSPHRAADRVQGILDGCLIAGSILFASWVTILGPLSQRHHGGILTQVLSLAYPASDVVMVTIVVILYSRAGQKRRASFGFVMAGLVAFAVADSAFTYMTEINNYGNGTFLDTGWVAGYLLIGLGALRAAWAPATELSEPRVTTLSLLTPYVPVLVVLAVTSVELLLGRHVGRVGWTIAFALAVLVLARHLFSLGDGATGGQLRSAPTECSEDLAALPTPDGHPALTGP